MSAHGIESVGFTDDGFVFFKIVTTYEEKPIETVIQFHPDSAVSFCKCLMEAAGKARETREVLN